MSIKVHNPLLYYYTNNQRVVDVNGETIGECLRDLAKRFPEMEKVLLDKGGNLHRYFYLYLNEVSAYPDELSKPVKDGDKLYITLTIDGGG